MDLSRWPELQGWDVTKQIPPNPLYTFNKDFGYAGDTVDVLIFIFEEEGGYTVRSSTEARSSGPYNYDEGYVGTIDEAIGIAAQVSTRFTTRLTNTDKK
jgi:hypothetical protein